MKNHYHKPDNLVAQGEGTAVNGLSVDDAMHNNNYINSSSSHYPWTISGTELSRTTDSTNMTGSYKTDGYNDRQRINIKLQHTHSLTSTDVETRPINYTIKVWKRIS